MKDKKWAQREVDRYLSHEGVNEARNALVFAKGVINQLDEPEVLSQEWIERNTSPVDDEGRLYIWKRDLQNLIVPKRELPVIPKYVADWIEEERDTMSNWKLSSRFISDGKYKKDQRRYHWSQVEGNMDKFMSALINGYEVEEEQKYYVLGKHDTPILFRDYMNRITETSNLSDIYPKADSEEFEFTEQEIKDYDERYLAFKVPVDEVVE